MNKNNEKFPKLKRELSMDDENDEQAETPPKKQPRASEALGEESSKSEPDNVYDAVLGEAEELLSAANEAQTLGRLKFSSTYLMLLHARLVGLGKQFDRAVIKGAPESKTVANALGKKTHDEKKVEEFAKFLPDKIEMDRAMIEHLARAAAELHHKRTGRRIQADSLLASPPPKAATARTPSSVASEKPGGIVWTEEEMSKVTRALQQGMTEARDIAAFVGTRNEAQVGAYLKLAEKRQKGAQAMEQEWGEDSPYTQRKQHDVSSNKSRKTAAQPINTMPDIELDARSLLKKGGAKKGS